MRTRQLAAKPSAACIQLGDGGLDDHLTDGSAGLAPSKRGQVHGFVPCREATHEDRGKRDGSLFRTEVAQVGLVERPAGCGRTPGDLAALLPKHT